MLSFRSPETLAEHYKKELHKAGIVPSIKTGNDYKYCLKDFARFANTHKTDIKRAGVDLQREFLQQKTTQVGQKQLDKYRQALKSFNEYYGRKEEIGRKEFKSHKNSEKLAVQPRAYTRDQMDRIQGRMPEKHQLATEIAKEAGLRASEAKTIAKLEERKPHDRPWRNDRFRSDQTERYTVIGKGGLCREIRLSKELAQRLEEKRLDQSQQYQERGSDYVQRYDLPGGQCLSQSWTHHSNSEVGWSAGFHGVRHTYAQSRMDELQKQDGKSWKEAHKIVSQELGHFSTRNTERYTK